MGRDRRRWWCLGAAALLVAACSGDDDPPALADRDDLDDATAAHLHTVYGTTSSDDGT